MRTLSPRRPGRALPAMLAVLGALAAIMLAGCSESTKPRMNTPRMRRSATLVVRDSLGAPAANATVIASSAFDSAGFAIVEFGTTDVDGEAQFTLAEGGWGVHAAATTMVSGATFVVPGASRPPADTVAVRLTLHTPSSVRGVVTLAGRASHDGTVVSSSQLAGLSVTDVAGRYQLGGLPPGNWTITMAHVGFQLGIVTAHVAAPGSADSLAAVQLVSSP